jgi:hypothetical protein
MYAVYANGNRGLELGVDHGDDGFRVVGGSRRVQGLNIYATQVEYRSHMGLW